MYIASQMMFDDTLHMIKHFWKPQGYSLTLCGHSLGAGVSCLLGIFLKDEMPDLKLQVYAFATPACCSYQASLDCSSYITSIVNNHDCVPRLSLWNVHLMHKLFVELDQRLEDKGLAPKDLKSARAYFKDIIKIDDNLLMTPDDFNSFLTKSMDRNANIATNPKMIDMELYVPGKVINMWNHTTDPAVVGGKVTSGQAPSLRQVFVERNMVSDHAVVKYRQNLLHLIEQTANTI